MSKKIKIHSIKYNFFMNALLTISGFIFPLITFPYVSRILGPAPNGKIAFAASVISYFSLLAAMGIPSYGVRKIAEVRDDQEKLNKTLTELVVINTLFTLLSYLLLLLLVLIVPDFRKYSTLIAITSIQIIFTTFGVDWFYQGIEQYDYITARNLAFKVIAVILMFILVHNPQDYIIYAGITVLGNVGSNFLNMIKLRDYAHFNFHISLNLKPHLQPIVTLFLYSAMTVIYTNLDQVMLGFMTSNREVGYYSATIKIENILTSLITSLGAVMLPRITYYLNHNGIQKFNELIIKSFNFVLLISIPLAIFFFLEADQVIFVLAGKGYERAGIILQCLIPAIIFVGLSSVTAWQMLIPLKMEKWVLVGSIVGALLDAGINLAIIPIIGGVGAALSTVIAECSVLVTHCIVLRKRLRSTIDWQNVCKLMIGNIFALIVLGLLYIVHFPILFSSGLTLSLKSSFINCVCVGIVYFGVYGITLLILKEQLVLEILGNIKQRFK
ncbi:flippase [Lactobacillus kefiranofaciens]|uniref:flippase n=1 Tax=Lactobacillus kefiranofaciens TaxID=267818 RepID=UPI0006D08DC9|nr:flippase [Lactobacillus kefiranofaciens]KRL28803.1 polymerization and export protein [Lactobacillus kefiranofaciens subsp. kefirgranum DSM 10550 = JCM 8572]MCJ2173017.1 flippase [Lactobacillus kefiranofaciens]